MAALVMVTITQRTRGIYLCHGSEDEHGTEEWEATSTLRAARRWGADYMGVRPTWQVQLRDGHWPLWFAEIETAGDDDADAEES